MDDKTIKTIEDNVKGLAIILLVLFVFIATAYYVQQPPEPEVSSDPVVVHEPMEVEPVEDTSNEGEESLVEKSKAKIQKYKDMLAEKIKPSEGDEDEDENLD